MDWSPRHSKSTRFDSWQQTQNILKIPFALRIPEDTPPRNTSSPTTTKQFGFQFSSNRDFSTNKFSSRFSSWWMQNSASFAELSSKCRFCLWNDWSYISLRLLSYVRYSSSVARNHGLDHSQARRILRIRQETDAPVHGSAVQITIHFVPRKAGDKRRIDCRKAWGKRGNHPRGFRNTVEISEIYGLIVSSR